MRYSPLTNGWYPEEIQYVNLPADIIEVSEDLYRDLVGRQIEVGPDGLPRECSPPALSSADVRAKLKASVTAKRWEVETGGITLPNGVKIKTAKDDQDRITATIAGMEGAGIESVDFKADAGWVTLTLPELQGIRSVIALHVQACFSAERAHHEAIDALDESALVNYDMESGWPA